MLFKKNVEAATGGVEAFTGGVLFKIILTLINNTNFR